MKYLFIDGENTRKTISKILENKDVFLDFKIETFLNLILPDVKFDKIIWYAAKIKVNKEDTVTSEKMIRFQRKLFNILRNQNIEIDTSGKIQRILVGNGFIGKKFIYKEKGVDVKMAVDITALSYTEPTGEVYLLSSDSDLVPAVEHAKKNGLTIIYLGTDMQTTNSLVYSCSKHVIIKEEDIIGYFKNKTPTTVT